ncbi:MAG: hypothetical protein K8R44_08920 [Sulfurimonas sp.]|jgi:hypothetical protein|nr:hypothetical protein [Sulfurimonas sp.]
MVKIFSIFLLLISLAFSNEFAEDSLLIQKVKTFVSEDSFVKNKDFIKLIFSPEGNYYRQDRVDVVRVVQTLKENGLLNLFFDKPQELKLSFKTNGSPLFFVKVMGDTLRNIGYYRYVTKESNLNNSGFTWVISLNAEYATDPLILQQELNKSGCSVVDIYRLETNNWEYSIDMSRGYLNVATLEDSNELKLKRSLYAHWLNVSDIKTLKIKSSMRDRWYPHITYYDKQLHLLKVIKKDVKTRTLSLVIPEDAKYIKISDIYTLKNVKDNLVLKPSGSK